MRRIFAFIFSEKFLLGFLTAAFILTAAGFGYWYYLSNQELANRPSNVVVHKETTVTTSTTDTTISQDVAEIDKEVGSIPDEDFGEAELNDSSLGL